MRPPSPFACTMGASPYGRLLREMASTCEARGIAFVVVQLPDGGQNTATWVLTHAVGAENVVDLEPVLGYWKLRYRHDPPEAIEQLPMEAPISERRPDLAGELPLEPGQVGQCLESHQTFGYISN